MKKLRPSQSAYTSFRVFLGFTFFLAGLSLAVTAFGGWPDLTAAMRLGSPKLSDPKDKLKAKTSRSTGGSKSMSVPALSGNGATPTNQAAQTQPASGAQNTVTESTNALGQVVYNISPSNFDISPPLTELARIVTPALPVEERPELELPPSRILHSDRPDPVTQVAPASRNSANAAAAPNAPGTGFNFAGIVGAGSFPPDNNGSVGNDQYVETVNTRYQVWTLNRATKTVTSAAGPSSINTLWSGFTGACQTQNAGDPVVLYDKVANRWLISQFTSAPAAGSYFQCVRDLHHGQCCRNLFSLRLYGAWPTHFGDYPHYRSLDRCLLRDGPRFHLLFRRYVIPAGSSGAWTAPR